MTGAQPRTVWITGASSGIGLELALSFARDGAQVAVSARSANALSALAAQNANIRAYPMDVTDARAAAETAGAIERDLGAIELAVFNAGVWHPMGAKEFNLAKAAQSVAVNYAGVLNCLDPVMRAMLARGRGHLAIVSSVAGYRGLPKSAAYGPTKAALINLCESIYPELKANGVRLSLINPGFVETPMTSVNTFPMPYLISARDAVEQIRNGLNRSAFEIVFPWRMALMMKALRYAPNGLFFWLTARMQGSSKNKN